ncbi:MAG: Zn-dependent hydrolase [Burkholderiales bacterium]|nr:Zn-dependent hydrolase [Burkholderiales bacterium]MDE2456622.1 Zn-dependent hydrolase [Burkholderiales bacterium]
MAAIDEQRLWASTQALAALTEADRPWTRRAFGAHHAQARQWLAEQFRAAGLEVQLDAGGNLCGRRPGRRPGGPVLMTGSHIDTVSGGGRYDGIIGVLAGLEIARALQQAGAELDHDFEVVDFLSEEPSDYGVSCVGSRALAGLLDAAMLGQREPGGETLAEGLARCGGSPASLGAPLRAPGSIAAFVELHIEQGPVLEVRGVPIGVVTHIVGIRRFRIVVVGRADHAGTTPMDLRQDALVGAARIIDAAQSEAARLATGPNYVVATVGRIQVEPNAANAVPARAELTLELRSDSEAVLERFADDLIERLRPSLQALRVSVSMDELSRSRPTVCDPGLMREIEAAAAELDRPTLRLPSGAGHDAVYLARLAPAAMIFIPCEQGRSHRPEEAITPAQLADGTQVLLRTLQRLDRAQP